jgi:hypothetical protein
MILMADLQGKIEMVRKMEIWREMERRWEICRGEREMEITEES